MRTRPSSILTAGSFFPARPVAVLYSELWLGQIFA
jgi:hypothetical protein